MYEVKQKKQKTKMIRDCSAYISNKEEGFRFRCGGGINDKHHDEYGYNNPNTKTICNSCFSLKRHDVNQETNKCACSTAVPPNKRSAEAKPLSKPCSYCNKRFNSSTSKSKAKQLKLYYNAKDKVINSGENNEINNDMTITDLVNLVTDPFIMVPSSDNQPTETMHSRMQVKNTLLDKVYLESRKTRRTITLPFSVRLDLYKRTGKDIKELSLCHTELSLPVPPCNKWVICQKSATTSVRFTGINTQKANGDIKFGIIEVTNISILSIYCIMEINPSFYTIGSVEYTVINNILKRMIS